MSLNPIDCMLSLIFSIISLACSRHSSHTSPVLQLQVLMGRSFASTSNTSSAPSHPFRYLGSSYSAIDEYAENGFFARITLSRYRVCVNWWNLSLGPFPILSNANSLLCMLRVMLSGTSFTVYSSV